MQIHWVGRWAIDGKNKLAMIADGEVIRDYATAAEMEFYKEILRLRRFIKERGN